MLSVKVKKLNNELEKLPNYQSVGAAGLDICANIDSEIILEKGKIVLVPTGIAISIPSGYECQVRSRSGLALKNGVFCLNSPGTIDSDYRGEVKVILANFSNSDFVIKNGDRIAQMVFCKYEKIKWELVDELDESGRGEAGFGSTGVK